MRLAAMNLAFVALAALGTPVSAFFRLPCKVPLVVQRADPIVNPGALSAHSHTIMGGNGFGFEMDYKSTQKSTCSSCIVTQDLSNYWVPNLYYKAKNGSFISVEQNGGMTVYYLQRSDARDPAFKEGILAFPEGFTMLAGDPSLRSFSDTPEQKAISYNCLGTDLPESRGFPKVNCPNGVRAQVFFPSCWDGVKYDPKDQKQHLAYPSNVDSGYCSPPFNKRVVSIFYEVIWNTPDFANMWYGNTQPFVWSNGDPTGYGYHGDFVNGWNVPVLQRAINECTSNSGVIEECKVFKFFTDNEAQGCKIPVSVHEQTSGVLPALPGCNPVQNGPAKAVKVTGCGAPTTIGKPIMPFYDVKSRGFKYIGCGLDIAGSSRTLPSSQLNDAEGMTVERCIDHCRTSGYSIAGLEFSSQCFCGNSIPQGRAPDPKRMGNCNMPCTGDDSQICGGAGLISLFQKCGAGSCENVGVPFINGSYTGNAPVANAGSGLLPIKVPTAAKRLSAKDLEERAFEMLREVEAESKRLREKKWNVPHLKKHGLLHTARRMFRA